MREIEGNSNARNGLRPVCPPFVPMFVRPPSRRAFWQARFYDFNVWTTRKRFEKLRYMHRNPVKRGLVESPERWPWSSYRFYLLGETGRRDGLRPVCPHVSHVCRKSHRQ